MTSGSSNADVLVYEEDLDLLKDYESNGRPLVDVLIEKYVETSFALVITMEMSLAASDLKTYKRSAHSLKSSSRSLGLRPLGDLAESAEHTDAFVPESADRLAALKQMHAECCDILRKRLKKSPGQGAA